MQLSNRVQQARDCRLQGAFDSRSREGGAARERFLDEPRRCRCGALVECGDLPDPERSDLDHSDEQRRSWTLGINAVFVIAIIGIIGFQVVKLLKARKRQAGAGLHFRIAGVFSLVALVPAVLLAIFATVSIDRTFDTFFSTRVKSIVSNSVEVAQSYMQESGQTIRSDIVGVGREVEEKASLYQEDKAAFDRFFGAAVALRAVPAAFIIDSKGNLLASASDGPPYRAPPLADIARASEGRIVPVSWDLSNGVAALKKLVGIDDAYLYALRPVNPNVFRLLQRTQFNIMQFAQLEQARGQYQLVFAIMYVLLALTLLTSAIWTGLVFANRLVMPIRKLIGAAQEVSQGNLDVHLDDGFARDDIGRLGATFKQMTVDLKTQHDDIMTKNSELDERRRFIEAVLSGVSAGVIGVDPAGCVTLANRSALELLGLKEEKLIGKPLKAVRPGIWRGDRQSAQAGQDQSCAKPDHNRARERRAQFRRPGDPRKRRQSRFRSGSDLRRRHRTHSGAADVGLGGRGAAHRA